MHTYYTYQIHLEITIGDWITGSILLSEKHYNKNEFEGLVKECLVISKDKTMLAVKKVEQILVEKYGFKIKEPIRALINWEEW